LIVKKSSTATYRREAYLKFSLSTVATVGSAKLRVYGRLHTSGNGIGVAVYPSSNTSWTESGLQYSNRPSASSTALKSVTVTGTGGKWYEFDVTSYLAARKAAGAALVTLVLKATASSGAYVVFNSDEASSNKPQLVVAPAPAATAARTAAVSASATARYAAAQSSAGGDAPRWSLSTLAWIAGDDQDDELT
jgi:hypothetical protein